MNYIKNIFYIIPLIICLLMAFSTKQFSEGQQLLPIVELYTSEGCSSCPAADKLLNEMSDIRNNEGKPFIGLSFHVTYWNRLGWIDSFSNESYTQRQKKYQSQLALSDLYTPQAIVNGKYEFVGSNSVHFRNALQNSENSKSSYVINASARLINNQVHVIYEADKERRTEWINVALIEKSAQRKITRGENKSRVLKHYNVVREFATRNMIRQDTVLIPLAPNLKLNNMAIVLYVQHKKTMKIAGGILIPVSQ